MQRALVLVAAACLAGCSMAGSTPIDVLSNKGCASDAGSYQLSKSYLKIIVSSARIGTTDMSFIQEIAETKKPDGEPPYCLDYIASQ